MSRDIYCKRNNGEIMTILERVSLNARTNPDRCAYIYNAIKNDKLYQESLTWRELNDFSDILAYYIKENANSNNPVIVYGHKSRYMPICFLASVKTGRAYVPIDDSMPIGRVKDIIDSVRPEFILSTEDIDLEDNRIIKLSDIKNIINNTGNKITRDTWIAKEDVYYIYIGKYWYSQRSTDNHWMP